jgi:hypothetical protein
MIGSWSSECKSPESVLLECHVFLVSRNKIDFVELKNGVRNVEY